MEHIGSSSVPGLGGRNVIDAVIPAEPGEHAALLARLYTLGFQDSPLHHFKPMLIGSLSRGGQSYTVLLYLMPPDSEFYNGWLAFRDYLRAHPAEARAYEAVKRRDLAEGQLDGWRYNQAKTPNLTALAQKIAADQSA